MRVVIESPFAGATMEKRLEHKLYLIECVMDSLERGEAPFASHGFYPQFLDDNDPSDRKRGMSAGWEWMAGADLVAVYGDLGTSPGMWEGVRRAQDLGIKVEWRTIR